MGKIKALFVIILIASTSVFAQSRCGTAQVFQSIRELRNTKNWQAQLSAYTSKSYCEPEDYYDSVYTKKTSHFQIFYTLDGPHKTNLDFVDTLANALEYAWNFHVKKTGMREPLGDTISYHYQKRVDPGLYPVEVAEITQLRNITQIVRDGCYLCFGLTLPGEGDSRASSLIIENDFKHPPFLSILRDSVTFNGKTCTYSIPTQPLVNTAHNYSYSEQWDKALRVTAAHELYHAVQLRYLDFRDYSTFWFEASASGIEEKVHPDVDDYIYYLQDMSTVVGTPIHKMDADYGSGIFLIYLYNKVSSSIDKLIWESFSKSPSKTFSYHLSKIVKEMGLSADSLFHDFAVRLSFTGKRATLADTSFWINNDQTLWPEFKATPASNLTSSPQTQELAYNFYTNGQIDFSEFKGHASVAMIKDNAYEIRFLPTLNSTNIASIDISNTSDIDSTIWILSRFSEEQVLPYEIKDSTLRAFPVPWREGSLCFTPLPTNKDYIEIRNRRGNLIAKENYSNNLHCIEEARVKELMVPGVYRFRAGNKGKLKDFIIVY